jgi:hypothetical protein
VKAERDILDLKDSDENIMNYTNTNLEDIRAVAS